MNKYEFHTYNCIQRVLFDLSLRNNLFSWVGIYLMKNRKCAPAAKWLQHKKGGKILYSVKEEWNEGKISDHFMNVINEEIIDSNGNLAVMIDSQTIDFGNGRYRIITIEDQWYKFGINGIRDLLEKDRLIHSKF